ncbi:hypothetical protein AWC02_15290 [Mycolicibacter engbaekii]|uniref:Hemerythrin-like domain-containing protein n=1 Tax=Mycolicibacter engbaekii TaxID=188915 RepID=A0A1X1TFQ0_9MYCO|nr:hemerythrin domain-containing protein [Mycolicibacter engbaekii]ORV43367.1 hypothetical protein AWC02_15290 [Mycolicibacter engbaekii]
MPGNDAPKRLIDRRLFVAGLGAAGIGVWTSACAGDAETDANGHADHDEQEVSPGEDLMREHGVLKRVLLIYDEAGRRIDAGKDLPPDAVADSADIIRTFIEDYHEKLEEDYLFPRFEKAGQLTDLTKVLRSQHQAGRRLTDRIRYLATPQTLRAPESAGELRTLLRQFTQMYEPHEAREDTVPLKQATIDIRATSGASPRSEYRNAISDIDMDASFATPAQEYRFSISQLDIKGWCGCGRSQANSGWAG